MRELAALLSPLEGRSPHLWWGHALQPGRHFDLQLAVHTGMGPGGIMCRLSDDAPWSSLAAASPWGAERLAWPARWSLGHGQRGPDDRPFRGRDLEAHWRGESLALEWPDGGGHS